MGAVVREFDPLRDTNAVEDLERRCEIGPNDGLSIFTDLLGDPLCRVRHSPAFLMLVAKVEGDEEILGVIRGCIKRVTSGTRLFKRGKNADHESSLLPIPVVAKLGYILGLRVSPSHRRMGVGLDLVHQMEQWFTESGAEYSYMATEKDNQPSVNLFVLRCGYAKFRTPSMLVQPVFAHCLRVSKRVAIVKLTPPDAESLYRRRFATTEFFPSDIDAVLHNELSLGTYVALPSDSAYCTAWPGSANFLAEPPDSWALLSVWNSKQLFLMEVRGASLFTRAFAKATRIVDGAFAWLGLPSVPPVFQAFGFHMLYGLGGEGPQAAQFMKALCNNAHNVARSHGCAVVITEVASGEPLKAGIPCWKSLCAEDLWCIKRLADNRSSDNSALDWTKSPPGSSIFVDPREF